MISQNSGKDTSLYIAKKEPCNLVESVGLSSNFSLMRNGKKRKKTRK